MTSNKVRVSPDGRRYIEVSTPGVGLVRYPIVEISDKPPQTQSQSAPISSSSPPTVQASSPSTNSQLSYSPDSDDDSVHLPLQYQTQSIFSQRKRPTSESRDRKEESPVNLTRGNLSFPFSLDYPAASQSSEQAAQTHPQDNRQENSPKVRPTLPTQTAERQQHQREVQELSKLLTSIRNDYAVLDKNYTNLVKDMSILTEKYRSLQKENEVLKNRNEEQSKLLKSIRHNQENLQKDNYNLVKERAVLAAETKSLQNDNAALRKLIQSLEAERTALGDKMGQDFARKEKDQQQSLKSLRADLITLRSENDELRKYIAQKEAEQQQSLLNEQHYIQQFQELKLIMEMWIAKHSKSSAEKELSQSTEMELMTLLGESGKMSSEFLKRKPHLFQRLYANTRSRIQLLRHIAAGFLFDQVFEPFTAGLPSSLSRELGNSLVSHGLL